MSCVLECGVRESEGVWTAQIWPVNVRPESAVVFDYVRSGDVEAVRGLLQSGQLTMRDHAHLAERNLLLLEVSLELKTIPVTR